MAGAGRWGEGLQLGGSSIVPTSLRASAPEAFVIPAPPDRTSTRQFPASAPSSCERAVAIRSGRRDLQHSANDRDYQLTGSALPSSYPAADCRPTRARSWNSATEEAPAYVNEDRTPEVIMSIRSSRPGRSGSR